MRVKALSIMVAAVMVACGSSSDDEADTGRDILIGHDSAVVDYGADHVAFEDGGSDSGQTGEEDSSGQDLGPDSEAYTREIVLMADTTFQQVAASQQYDISVVLKDLATDSPLPLEAVTFKIAKVEELAGEEIYEWDGKLNKTSVITDNNGYGTVTFTAGETVDLKYTVNITSNGAEPVTIELVVLAIDCACLNVAITYDGTPGMAASYRVVAMDPSVKCADLEPGKPLPSIKAQVTHTTIEEPANIPCVGESQSFTVYVSGEEECPFAVGCVEGAFSGEAGGTCGTITVNLTGVDLSLEGKYDGTHTFRFSDALPDCTGLVTAAQCLSPDDLGFTQKACCYLMQCEQVFKTDGAGWANAMKAQADEWDGTKLNGGESAQLDSAIDSVVPSHIAGNTPEWIVQMAAIGNTVRGVIANVTVSSQMVIDEAEAGAFPIDFKWLSYTLYWKVGCDSTDPEYYKCGKLLYPMSSFGGLSYTPAMTSDSTTIEKASANNVSLQAHDVGLNPGRLLAFVMNKIAVRGLSGAYINDNLEFIGGSAASVQEGALVWVDCDTVGASLYAQVSSWFDGTQADLVDLCESAVKGVVAPSETTLVSLTQPAHLSLSATGAVTDKDCDMSADTFTSGVYTGSLVVGDENLTAKGSFTATRD